MQEELTRVLDAMFEKRVTSGDHVIDQGDDGDNFYVVDRYVIINAVLFFNEMC